MAEYFQYSIQGIFYLLAGALTILTGVVVLVKNFKSKLSQSFFLFTLASFMWIFSFGMAMMMRDVNDVWLWSRMSYILGIPFIPVWTFVFSNELRGEKTDPYKLVAGILFAAASIVFTWFSAETVGKIREFYGGRYIGWHLNPLSIAHCVLAVVPFLYFASLSFHNFYLAWRTASDEMTQFQNRNIFFAFIVAYSGSIDLISVNGVGLYPFGYISLTLSILIIGYNIVKHQFFEVRIVFKKITLVFLVYSVLILFIIPFLIPLIHRLSNNNSSVVWGIFIVGGLVGVALSMGPFIYAYLIRNNFWLRGHSSIGLAHDLKVPVAAINSSLEILKSEVIKNKLNVNKINDYLQMIQGNTDRIQRSANNLLHIANIQEGNVHIEKSRVDIDALILKVGKEFDSVMHEKKIDMKYDLRFGETLFVDKSKIEQVILNLISNAVKFTHQGGVRISTYKKGQVFFFEITDSGVGLLPEHKNKIFHRFYQVDKGTKGTGLGLAVSKAWVEAHRGKIWVEPREGENGSTFMFRIPIQKIT